MVEFLRGSGSLDVLCVEPDEGAGNELLRCRRTSSVGGTLVLGLSDGDLVAEIVVEVG